MWIESWWLLPRQRGDIFKHSGLKFHNGNEFTRFNDIINAEPDGLIDVRRLMIVSEALRLTKHRNSKVTLASIGEVIYAKNSLEDQVIETFAGTSLILSSFSSKSPNHRLMVNPSPVKSGQSSRRSITYSPISLRQVSVKPRSPTVSSSTSFRLLFPSRQEIQTQSQMYQAIPVLVSSYGDLSYFNIHYSGGLEPA